MKTINKLINEEAKKYLDVLDFEPEIVVLDTYTYASLLEECSNVFNVVESIYIDCFDKELYIQVDEDAEQLISFI